MLLIDIASFRGNNFFRETFKNRNDFLNNPIVGQRSDY